MEKKKFIQNLFAKRASFNDDEQAEMMAHLLDTVSSDIYSESQRFVFELIQNADDASTSDKNQVHFELLSDSLIVSHNGKAFDDKDIGALTGAGFSTKKSDPTKTGYKGIGFKSVFGMSENVAIFSQGYQFRFDKNYHPKKLPWQSIPIWTETSDIPADVATYLSKSSYQVHTILSLKNMHVLKKDLKELLSSAQILLFLRHVSKITVREGMQQYYIEKDKGSEIDTVKQHNLYNNGKLTSSWLLKTFSHIAVPDATKNSMAKDDKTPPKLKDAQFAEISFAAKVHENKILSLKAEESLLFTYLPTKVTDFQFPFLVNGSFVTNAPREALHEDRAWNHWLFELIAEMATEWLVELSGTKFNNQLLRLLPAKFNATVNELKRVFDRKFSEVVVQRPFILTSKGTVKKVRDVIVDKTGLSLQPFIDPAAIVEYISIEKQKTYVEDCFVHPDLEDVNKLKAIGAETFELNRLDAFFASDSFTRRHKVDHNFELIKYFKEKSDNDKKGFWFQMLRILPFIFDDQEILQNPSTGICFPTGIEDTELGRIPVIHPTVFTLIESDVGIYNWLKTLGVKEPSQVTYVTNVLVPNQNTPGYINNSNFLQITHYLFRLHKQNSFEPEVLESLREFPVKIKGKNNRFEQAQKCFLSNRYQPGLPIEGVISNVPYVSEEYLFSQSNALEWNLFFKALKVKDRVEIESIDNNSALTTLRVLTAPDWVKEAEEKALTIPGAFGFGDHNVIKNIKIPTFLNSISTNFDYCKLFWKDLMGNEISPFDLVTSARFYYGVGFGMNSYSTAVENYFPWFIKHKACIPTTSGEILFPQQVFINDKEIKQIAGPYLPVFDFDGTVTGDWRSILNLKPKLELVDYLKLLTKMAEESEDSSNPEGFKRRIGLIYGRLAGMLPELTTPEKQQISAWSERNSLLTTSGSFNPASEVKWVTIDGFSSNSEILKIIELPVIAEKNKNAVKELLTLLNVQIIDKFTPIFEIATVDNSLKTKLENILPYFSALVAKRYFEDSNHEFLRLYSILNDTTFYSASEIKLTFTHKDEVYDGPSLTVYKEPHSFYFKGRWQSERTMLSLIRELASLLNISDLNEELRFLLLETETSEIWEWLIEQGIEIKNIIPIRPFTKVTENIPPLIVQAEASLQPEFTAPVVSSPFNPSVKPYQVGEIGIHANKKTFTTDTVTRAETRYSEIQSEEVREDVGRWSEEFVDVYLSQNENMTESNWVNKEQESGLPYDFTGIEKGKRKYIDVKGTPSSVKDIIYLSPAEWTFMFEKGENYAIYRVYDAGTAQVRIEIIDNPALLLQKGKIFPNPITLQI